jgi:hypothetical protein
MGDRGLQSAGSQLSAFSTSMGGSGLVGEGTMGSMGSLGQSMERLHLPPVGWCMLNRRNLC